MILLIPYFCLSLITTDLLTTASIVCLLIIPFSLALPCLAENWEKTDCQAPSRGYTEPSTSRMGFFIEGSSAGRLAIFNLCAYIIFNKLTSLCNCDSLFGFYMCFLLLFTFLYEPHKPPNYHYCSPYSRLLQNMFFLPNTSCFLVACTP